MLDEPESAAPADNARPYSVSELAFALKRTLEDGCGASSTRSPITPTATST